VVSRQRFYFFVAIILLVGAGLRIQAATGDRRFHPDEALFASLARHATLGGDWLLSGSLDKPPVGIYAQAVAMALTAAWPNEAGVLDFSKSQGEFAARLPALLSGIILIAVVIALALSLYRNPTVALWAGLFAALSPLAVSFSGTGFLDMPMILLSALGLLAASRDRWALAGIFLACATGIKFQGALFIPLALLVGLQMHPTSLRSLLRFVMPLAAGLLLMLLWDGARRASASMFQLALAHNPGHAIAFSINLSSFTMYLPSLLGAPTAIFAVLVPVSLGLNLWRGPRNRALWLDLSMLGWATAVILLHALLGHPLYDRYALLIWLPVVLVSARAGVYSFFVIQRGLARSETQVLAAAVAVAMFISAQEAAQFRPGYDSPASSLTSPTGIDLAAAYLNQQHVAAVVYDPWSTWLFNYYAGEWSSLRRVHYSAPAELVTGALALDECELRFLVAPTTVDTDAWISALEQADFTVSITFQTTGWVIYAINPQSAVSGCAGDA
jgi:4-amino-4-deoxy-L-arabinose transferase-like glycosyltransferase